MRLPNFIIQSVLPAFQCHLRDTVLTAPFPQSRHSGAEALRSLFKSDNKHGASKGEDGNDTEADEAAIALKVQSPQAVSATSG
jgi:hypothetical protein